MSPWIMWRVVGYWLEREESLDGVRASTFTVWPPARQCLRMERPVPPVAPKRAMVLRDGVVDVDILVYMVGCERFEPERTGGFGRSEKNICCLMESRVLCLGNRMLI